MDWVTGLQKAIIQVGIIYRKTDMKRLRLKRVCRLHFQRIFSIMCNCSLGEYIRNRRLTLAGAELNQSSVKVIDVALKYGYESRTASPRHLPVFMVSPICARAWSKPESFSSLSIKISLEGGNIMDKD